jgi:sulfane dehydrogenase subunit SoxC
VPQDGQPFQFRAVGDGTGVDHTGTFSREEVQLALRNRGMPLEALRYPITPTGLHYLLTHFDIPDVDAASWRLKLGGLFSNPLSLTLDDIKTFPARSFAVTMECSGNGRALWSPRRLTQPWLLEAISTAEWTGTPLSGVLEEVGLNSNAVEIVFTGLDQGVEGGQVRHYERSLTVSDAIREEVLLAYEMNGEALPPHHGAPLRLIAPGWYGMASVKWLGAIEAIGDAYDGFHNRRAFRFLKGPGEKGEPVTLMRPRALMVPPGIPDLLTRTRVLDSGNVLLIGKAWAGRTQVVRVEFSADDGKTWADADVGEPVSQYAWRPWSYEWPAERGLQILCLRATDSEGEVQPVEQNWNYGGYANNGVQRVEVIVS